MLLRHGTHNTTHDGTETINRKATSVAPGSTWVCGQVAVRGVAPTWEGGH